MFPHLISKTIVQTPIITPMKGTNWHARNFNSLH